MERNGSQRKEMPELRQRNFGLSGRLVNTVDAMTATIEPIDWPVLMKITDRILKEVKNVNRVCYDMILLLVLRWLSIILCGHFRA